MKRKTKFRYLGFFLAVSMLLGNGIPVWAESDTMVDSGYLPKENMIAEASTSGGAAYTADKAIDGNTNTIWHGQWEGKDIPPHWISVQIDKEGAQVKQIREIKLTLRNDVNPSHESINNVKCTIWVSENGKDYTEAVVDAKLNNGKGAETSVVLNRNASHIKITGSPNFMALAEIDIMVYSDEVDMENRLELEAKINKAQEFLDAADIGTYFNQYPQSAADSLQKVISEAKTALTGDNEKVIAALQSLDDAVKTFQDAKKIFKKTDMENLIIQAEELYNRITPGDNIGNCSEEAKERFAVAIEKAKSNLDNEDMDKLLVEYEELKKASAVFMSSIIVEDENDSIDISGIWNFSMTAMENAGSFEETVKLPGSMDENKKGINNTSNISPTYLNRDYIYVGEATYQREIQIPDDWDGKNITLFMERTRKTRVWVDGKQVGSGQQKSYTTPHEYDLTDYVKAGESHTLTIEVDNSPKGMPEAMYTTFEKDFPWGHMVSEHTQTNWNGILGEMKLEASPAIYVDSFQIRPDVDRNIARVEMKLSRKNTQGDVEGSIELQASSYNNEEKKHIQDVQNFTFHIPENEKSTKVVMEYEMGSDVLLWDEFSPNLYEMVAVVRSVEGNQIHSSIEKESFGMRKFEALYIGDGGKQFAVNGRATQLRGEINCAVFPMTAYAPMDLESWIEVMKTYKEYGLNHVRFHTWTPPKAAFEAADQLGLYIQYELPQWGHKMFGDIDKGDTSVADYYWEESMQIFDEYLNSPSAVMMALGNELRPGFYYYDIFLEKLEQVEPELLYTDIAGWSAYSENVEFSGSVPTKGANYLHRVDPSTNWTHWDNTNKTPVPFLAHEPGQLQVYPDYEEEIAKYYNKNSLLKPRNLEHFQKILERAGMGDMDKKFNQSSGELSAMLYRYMTEGYLRTPGAGGFQLLGLQDFSGQGTALIGMLDAFMESKGDITPAEFRQSCSELTVLGKISKFTWQNNEIFEANIVIPNYSAKDVTTSVSWTLETKEGKKILSGKLEEVNAVQGKVTNVGTIKADLKDVVNAEGLKLHLKMDNMPDKATAPYAEGMNEYSIWVYPSERIDETGEDVQVYSQLNNQAKKALEEGKNVLIVSPGTKEALPKSKAVTFRPDFWSPMFHSAENDGYVLGCYIDENHPMFADFPTDTFANFQWYDLVNRSRSILLDGAPVDLKPIVQAIPTIDLGDRLGSIFEAKVGEGKLVVSSIDLLNKDSVVAKQLLYSIKNYMASEEFNPMSELEVDYVKQLLPANDMNEIQAEIKTEMEIGESQKINVKCKDYKGNEMAFPEGGVLTYESGDENIVEVAEDGTVTGKSAGMTEIKITLTAGGITYETTVVVIVGALKPNVIPTEEFEIKVSSEDPSYPHTNMVDGNEDTFWHSDYSNKNQGMPQEVEINFKSPTEVSGIISKARRKNSGGAILKASVQIKRSGQNTYETVVEHAEFTKNDTELVFAFPKTEVDSVKLIIEEAVMDSTSSNAAAIAELKVYQGDIITDVAKFPAKVVRFGTKLEKILGENPLPDKVEITINGKDKEQVPVIWDTSSYNSAVAGEYALTGTIFCENAANVSNQKAKYPITVLPKDLTTPADKTEFDKVLGEAGKYQEEDYTPESWKSFYNVYQQAKSFGALTNATQHDTDVMTEKLLEVMEALVPRVEEIEVTGITLDKDEVTLKIGNTVILKAVIAPENATDKNVTWTSSNPDIAEVNNMGMVTAKAEGETLISVVTKDGGFKAECQVIVTGGKPENPEEPEEPENPEKPDKPEKPEKPGNGNSEETSKPSKPNKPKLPQTGAMVGGSLMALVGVVALGAGLVVLKRKRNS